MKKLINKIFLRGTDNALVQLLRYAVVGAIAAAANFFCLFFLTDVCGMYYLASNGCAFVAGLAVNYALCKRFVFLTDFGNRGAEFLVYGLIGLVGLLFDTGLMYFFTDALAVYYLLSKIISTAIVMVWNFTARKFIYIIIENKRKQKS
jgi:putative flippase GtrA